MSNQNCEQRIDLPPNEPNTVLSIPGSLGQKRCKTETDHFFRVTLPWLAPGDPER